MGVSHSRPSCSFACRRFSGSNKTLYRSKNGTTDSTNRSNFSNVAMFEKSLQFRRYSSLETSYKLVLYPDNTFPSRVSANLVPIQFPLEANSAQFKENETSFAHNNGEMFKTTSNLLNERRYIDHSPLAARHNSQGQPYPWLEKIIREKENETLNISPEVIANYAKSVESGAVGRTSGNLVGLNTATQDHPGEVLSSEEPVNSHKVDHPIIEEITEVQQKKPANTSIESTKKSVNDSKSYEHRERLVSIYGKVLVVDNLPIAKEVVEKLTNEYKQLTYACDTEVAKIDVKHDTPVDHGEIICFSIYGGPNADFGNGQSCIWVDVLDGGGKDILDEFAPFFEDPLIKKVWHNYSFDNHVIENYGLKLNGFHADTMHMARLWDSSRKTEGGYSLEALTGNADIMSIDSNNPEEELIGKVGMKTIFGRYKVNKNGCEGKIMNIPSVEELQREERKPWICYSALDSISTLKLYENMKKKLENIEWRRDGVKEGNMFEFYETHWRPFGELLVKMENEGMLVDRAYLAGIEKVAVSEQQKAVDRFRNWASKYCPDAKYMSVGSDLQLRQLFFGGCRNSKNPSDTLPEERTFNVSDVHEIIKEGKPITRKSRSITLKNIVEDMPAEIYTASGWPSMSGDALKALAGKVSAEYNVDRPGDDTSAYGTAYKAFGKGQAGKEACHAIAALCEVCSIDSLISNFIVPLQGTHISGKNGRVHCSLNINTETGRLSARRPNLQNQPALEKDRYKIRKAFVAAPGNSLVVADYGQLELRILAHLANCKSMRDAFKAGGDFHSRTAMNMYPHIREAVNKKQVLLEWISQPGEDKPPVPLLKDAFASERRKAKMLNFSIAYGKTPVGLAKDWKVSVQEARKTVELWYKERKEVKDWQNIQIEKANKEHCVHTLLGRARLFPSLVGATYAHKNHIERAAINTPVQGSAADVAMCAMLKIAKNTRLEQLGWRLILQVHDEVILEGPTESAEEAKAIVVECMEKPFDGKNILNVDLSVDAKCAQNWYSAK